VTKGGWISCGFGWSEPVIPLFSSTIIDTVVDMVREVAILPVLDRGVIQSGSTSGFGTTERAWFEFHLHSFVG